MCPKKCSKLIELLEIYDQLDDESKKDVLAYARLVAEDQKEAQIVTEK